MPQRIQLSRVKGWRMPPNTIKVTRPGKWGNPFPVEQYGRGEALRLFRETIDERPEFRAAIVTELRGRNLACWCRATDDSHADILLAIANEDTDAAE